MIRLTLAIDALNIQLDPWPIPPEKVVSGAPRVSGKVLRAEPDGGQTGVWEITPGVSSDVEVDEVFVVLFGRAEVEVEGGPRLDLVPGTVGFLSAGARTIWHVHETLRKVYRISGSDSAADLPAGSP